jgi:membrane protease YdiL (CAAX protease family)
VGLGFLASLLALAWPVRRGIGWDEVRRDVGWTTGERAWLEPLIGAGGYLCALPLVGIGLVLTLLLLGLQGLLGPEPSPFAPAGGPAHPIVLQLAESGWWLKLQVLFLASVAAPIVEETMFRGVLYRHLRDATSRFGTVLSVLVSGMLNGLIFAAIHPQGWVAIPALMALAWAFVLLREWRGTLVPAMVVHAISNGVVMLALIAILRLS